MEKIKLRSEDGGVGMRLIDADEIAYESIDSSDTEEYSAKYGTGILAVRKEDIDKMPPAEPKRIRAKWIATTALQEGQITWRDYKCSNCSHHRGKPMNFCEVCGAKMER